MEQIQQPEELTSVTLSGEEQKQKGQQCAASDLGGKNGLILLSAYSLLCMGLGLLFLQRKAREAESGVF